MVTSVIAEYFKCHIFISFFSSNLLGTNVSQDGKIRKEHNTSTWCLKIGIFSTDKFEGRSGETTDIRTSRQMTTKRIN